MSLLALENIEAAYGAVPALFDVQLSVAEGEVVALMGRNGMGKSTTIKVICRLLQHQSGTAQFAGRDLAELVSYQAAQSGIGLVPEGRRCFTNLSVLENLVASSRPGYWNLSTVTSLFPQLHERIQQLAGSLSGGEQQMLAIGRALMTNPRLLVLDEATEGLAPVVRQQIWSAISTLKQETGLAILLVDKSIRELSKVADRAVILERGTTVWSGAFDELDKTVTDRYLGV